MQRLLSVLNLTFFILFPNRQFIDLGGFYDVKRLSWCSVVDVTLAATAAPPGGGRSMISSRILKHFSVLAVPQPSTKSLQHIYQVRRANKSIIWSFYGNKILLAMLH